MGWEISFLVVYAVIEAARLMQGASRAARAAATGVLLSARCDDRHLDALRAHHACPLSVWPQG